MFLMFLNTMVRVEIVFSSGKLTLKETSFCSDMGVSDIVQFKGVTPYIIYIQKTTFFSHYLTVMTFVDL